MTPGEGKLGADERELWDRTYSAAYSRLRRHGADYGKAQTDAEAAAWAAVKKHCDFLDLSAGLGPGEEKSFCPLTSEAGRA